MFRMNGPIIVHPSRCSLASLGTTQGLAALLFLRAFGPELRTYKISIGHWQLAETAIQAFLFACQYGGQQDISLGTHS